MRSGLHICAMMVLLVCYVCCVVLCCVVLCCVVLCCVVSIAAYRVGTKCLYPLHVMTALPRTKDLYGLRYTSLPL